ncbi:MAG TPA: hypothetical protein PL048_00640 [Leptospiraceae bacterium]|nr:hypothetical protein [Leptospiraceae bacterium]HMY65363.1 hypothetical protein [Leptospiraceae bacterium]HMZ57249.1 hypothetical protein [Leptospiraceae bacterium]HNF14230.1 hypothetical protein [Leptospiraceae bacterium]HNF23043.1 hypothetical protein [Leptospiraceae bacterium]
MSCSLIKNKSDYKDLGMEYFEQKYRYRNTASLQRRAALGLSVLENPSEFPKVCFLGEI